MFHVLAIEHVVAQLEKDAEIEAEVGHLLYLFMGGIDRKGADDTTGTQQGGGFSNYNVEICIGCAAIRPHNRCTLHQLPFAHGGGGAQHLLQDVVFVGLAEEEHGLG